MNWLDEGFVLSRRVSGAISVILCKSIVMRQTFGVALVEPNVLLREGLVRILNAGPFRIITMAASIDDYFLSRLSQARSVLLVIGNGGNPDDTARQIALFKENQGSGRVVVLADHYQLSDVASALRAGANGYITKVTTCDAFVKTLELVMLGETIVPSEILSFIFAHYYEANNLKVEADAQRPGEAVSHDARPLSSQEARIMCHLVAGLSNKLIARKINITEATVKVHVKAILRKIRVQNRTQAVVWAIHNGSFVSMNEGLRQPFGGNGKLGLVKTAPDEVSRRVHAALLSRPVLDDRALKLNAAD
jgi:two-component system nitrate/nitrite response regulator NarL